MTTRWHCSLWLLVLNSLSCSLMGLGEFDYRACDAADQNACAALNLQLPPDSPERYYCHPSGQGCELRSRDAEVFDGLDNDRDNYLDEDTTPTLAATLPIAVMPRVHSMSEGQGRDGSHFWAITGTSDDVHFTTRGLITQPSEPPALLADDLSLEWKSCPDLGGTARCNFEQVAIAAAGDVVFGVGIHKSSCADGQVRVGFSEKGLAALQLGEQPRASNVGMGIDPDPTQGCTEFAGCTGVTAPLIAALNADATGDRPRALALWTSPAGSACLAAGERAVMALGLSLEHEASGNRGVLTETGFLTGTNAGHAQRVGTTNEHGSVALLALSGRAPGFLLAYAGPQAVHLQLLPDWADSSLGAHPELGVTEWPADQPRGVQLVADVQAADTRGLALAWVSGPHDAPVVTFAELTVDVAGARVSLGSPVVVERSADAGAIVEGPVLAYASSGFAPKEQQAGWLLLWVEAMHDSRRLMAARIAKAGPKQLGPAFELASGAVTKPFAYAGQSAANGCNLFYGFVREDQLHWGRYCPARAD